MPLHKNYQQKQNFPPQGKRASFGGASSPFGGQRRGGAPRSSSKNSRNDRDRGSGQEGRRTESEFEQRVIEVRRVVRVTAGGRRFSFRVLVAVGNHKGKVGFGMGKAKDISEAIGKANNMAMKRVIEIPLTRKTIPFEVTAKFKMARILLKPAPLGRGVIAGGTVRYLCELAGIENITSKVLSGSKSKLNNAKAVLHAFSQMKSILGSKRERKREENAS